MTAGALPDRLRRWESKPVLRAVYQDFYHRIAAACGPGITLEIGGGIGNLKRQLPDVIASDIQFAPGLDCVIDAQRLPVATASIANLVMVDVLHHLDDPLGFFREAERVLRPGGRIVMVEPAITPGSALFYRFAHREPVRTGVDPLRDRRSAGGPMPTEPNQAIPTLIATRHRACFHALLPALRIARTDWFSLASYPLSGGFQPWVLIPAGLAGPLMWAERVVERAIGRLAAFRLLLVIEKARAQAARRGQQTGRNTGGEFND
jgi:SAM-dependent methyltransferase